MLILNFCTTLVATTVTNYQPGNDYLYRYEVITTSALRAANHQTAGLKITTNVRMEVNAQKVVVIKVIINIRTQKPNHITEFCCLEKTSANS